MATKRNVTARYRAIPIGAAPSRRRSTKASGGKNSEFVAVKLPRHRRSAVCGTIPVEISPTAASSQSGASRSRSAARLAIPNVHVLAGNNSESASQDAGRAAKGASIPTQLASLATTSAPAKARSRSASIKTPPGARPPTGTYSESGSDAGAGEAENPTIPAPHAPRRQKSPRKGKGVISLATDATQAAFADDAHSIPRTRRKALEGGGRTNRDAQGIVATSLPNESDGRSLNDILALSAIAGREVHYLPAIAKIENIARHRWQLQRAQTSLILQANAICRRHLGTHGQGKASSKSEASALFDQSYRDSKKGVVKIDAGLAMMLIPFWEAIPLFETKIAAAERDLKKVIKELPIAAWVKSIPGFGEINLANLVGAAQDIGSFKSPSALWKRMGLAVISGERQRRYTDVDMALLHGYSPRRRALAYLLGEAMIKKPNRYRAVYDARKVYEQPRCEAIEVEKRAKGQKYSPKAHAHARSMRYMVKRVLRDLYNEWRRLDREALA